MSINNRVNKLCYIHTNSSSNGNDWRAIRNSTDAFHKYNIEQKKLDTNEYACIIPFT